VDVVAGEARIAERLTDRAGSGFDQVRGQLVELSAREGQVEVLRAGGVSGDIREVDVGGGHAGELDLGLLGSFLQALHGDLVAAEVDAVGTLELADHPLHDALIEVVAAEAVVARGGQNLNNTVVDIEDGDIERTAAKVVDHDLLALLLVDAVGEGRGRRLIDDTLDLEAGDLTGVLGRLTLRIGEVSGNGDDGFAHGAAEVSLSVALELLQDHRADLLRSVLLTVNFHFIIRTHFALDRRDRAVGVGDGLTLCDLADHTLAGLTERDDGRGGAVTFGVGDDDGFAAFHHGHTRVGSTKVNTDNFRHNVVLLRSILIFLLTTLYVHFASADAKQIQIVFSDDVRVRKKHISALKRASAASALHRAASPFKNVCHTFLRNF